MNVLPQAVALKRIALDLVFPRRCVGCGVGGSFICRDCLSTLPRVVPPLCPRCGCPQPSGLICPDCIGWQAEIDGIRSVFRFEGTVRQAVYQLKYRNLRAIVPDVARFMADFMNTVQMPGDVIVPVPLHRKRLRERGYNQSALIARAFGTMANLPVEEKGLERILLTPPQARTTNLVERKNNLQGAFACPDGFWQDKRVLLVDDVATSGATLDACADALKEAGATSVWGLTLAREV